MSKNLNVQGLRIFLSVFDTGSVGATATALGMSQSGVSTALARLRDALGDALFVNTAAGMQPTTRAKELVAPMREALQCIEQRILSTASFDPQTDDREFRVAASDTAESIYMPRVLNLLTRQAPHVRLRVVAMAQPQLQRAMSEGQIDVAMGFFPDLLSAEFVRRRIGQHAFVCVCSANNHAMLRDFSLKKYTEARHVLVEAVTRTHGLLETYVAKRGIHRKAALKTPHFMSLPEIIANTDLIATVPDAVADSFADNRRLARLPLPFRSPVFDAHLHWSKRVNNDPAHRWLRNAMFNACVSAKL